MKITIIDYFKDEFKKLLEDLNPNDIFTEDQIIEFVSENYEPDEIFSIFQLNQWARKNKSKRK